MSFVPHWFTGNPRRGSGRRHALLLPGVLALTLGTTVFAQSVQINELQSANDHTLSDEDGDSSDWIELWNSGPVPYSLDGHGLSDSASTPFKWVFALGTTMAPGEFLVLFASGKDRQPNLVPALSPTNVAGLQLWLRADAVQVSDATQVRTDGGMMFVRQWRDQSGHGNHAVQGSDILQPRWLASGAAGFPSVRFDGVNDLLRLARPLGTNDFCVIAVCRTSQAHETDAESTSGYGGTSGQRWLFGAYHGGDLDGGAGVSIGTNGVGVYEHGSGYMPALVSYPRAMGTGVQIIVVNYAARQPTLDHQGLTVRPGLTSPRRQVWAPVEIGSGAYGAFGGDLSEAMIFNRALSVDERRGLARHLAERYGVSLPLPRHTSFQLSAGGEGLVLTRPDGSVQDRVIFGGIPRDVSYGRSPTDPTQWFYFATPTPGASNTTPGSTEWLFPPGLSHEGGFYSNAFDLSLTSPNSGAEIRYTLDGSEPTTQSPLYSLPIAIRSRAGTPNDLSAIPTVPGGQPPTGEVFKGWTVRARAFKPGAMPSPVVTRTYWIHPRGRGRYSTPVVALSTDRRNFFDADIGIYVVGNSPGGNYSQRGPEWERPVFVEFYETDNRLAFGQDGDVKIHGNTSQGFPIKGLDLDGTGGAGREPFHHAIFPGRTRSEFEHFLLRPSGHDHGMAFMRDELMQELGSETGAESQAARPCVVFLNGEYWGLHYLKEKEDEAFVSFYGDVPVDALDYLEGYAAAKAGDTLHYDSMVQFISANDPSLPASYQRIQTLMDVLNYIDYKVCEIFNYRWDIGNHRLWRPRTPEGRWRWLQFDNDVGWGGFWAEQPGWTYDMLTADLTTDGRLHGHNNETTTFFLRRLVRNQTFVREFLNRFADLLNSTFLPDHTIAHINGLAAQLAPEMAEHCMRWRAPASVTDWQAAVNYLREFASQRPGFCRQHLVNYFGLPGTVRVTVEVFSTGNDAVRLNTLPVFDADGNGWKGIYFRGLALPVRAESAPGHHFVRWIGPVEGVGPVTSLTPTNDLTLYAVFSATAPRLPHVDQVRWTTDDRVEVQCSADPLQTLALETSIDLARWNEEAWVVTDADGVGVFAVKADATVPSRFFRARLP